MSAPGQSGFSIYFTIRLFAFLLSIVAPGIVIAQPAKLSIKETMEKVQHNLPQLEAYRQQAEAAKENISLAKNSLVPDLTAGYQVNMATYNNITGMSYPGFL